MTPSLGMRIVAYFICLIVGQTFLWTWVGVDPGGRWMLGVAIVALVCFAIVAAARDDVS
jgi:hypothetical protein